MKNTMTWEQAVTKLNLSEEDKICIELEEQIIETMINIRKDQGLSQKALADLCDCKQSSIARLETMNHSPQVDSLLKILVPLGYKLAIVPIE